MPLKLFTLIAVGAVLATTVTPVLAQVGCGVGFVTCAVTTAGLSFGTGYAPFSGAPTDAMSDVDITCTLPIGVAAVCTIPYSIALDTGSSGSFAARQMSSLGNTLQYNVYTDLAHTIVWGDGSGATDTVDDSLSFNALLGLGQVRTRSHTAYGRIPANQPVDEGVYADTLTLTVTY